MEKEKKKGRQETEKGKSTRDGGVEGKRFGEKAIKRNREVKGRVRQARRENGK